MYLSSPMSVDPFMGARALSRDSTLGACTRAALDKSSATIPFFLSGSFCYRFCLPARGFVGIGCCWMSMDLVGCLRCLRCRRSCRPCRCRRSRMHRITLFSACRSDPVPSPIASGLSLLPRPWCFSYGKQRLWVCGHRSW